MNAVKQRQTDTWEMVNLVPEGYRAADDRPRHASRRLSA
jgi:hypothetical protein